MINLTIARVVQRDTSRWQYFEGWNCKNKQSTNEKCRGLAREYDDSPSVWRHIWPYWNSWTVEDISWHFVSLSKRLEAARCRKSRTAVIARRHYNTESGGLLPYR